MEQKKVIIDGPQVSVIIPTYNRPTQLGQAIASAVGQTYSNLQIIVVNDGGCDVSDVVKQFSDANIKFIDRPVNRGKAYSLNEAIAEANSKYIAYLDDDDIYYPNHIESLVEALENSDEYQAAYSDLYKTYSRQMPDEKRHVLGKVLEVSRDFDRYFILYFNHVLHVSLMHTKKILEKTGLYNENLRVLIDWDITRRLVFFTDFCHVGKITGEYNTPAGENDRISYLQRKEGGSFAKDFLTIRTSRPAKPWTKLKDLSIILTAQRLDRLAGKTVGSIWKETFYPYKLYIPVCNAQTNGLNTDMPNLVFVPAKEGSSQDEQIDTALGQCEGDFVAIVPADFAIEQMWIEEPLYGLIQNHQKKVAYSLDQTGQKNLPAVFRKDELLASRKKFSNLSAEESISKYGIEVRKLEPKEIPFQFDSLLKEAKEAEQNGCWREASEIYEYIGRQYKNQLWMNALAAQSLYKSGEHTRSLELAGKINRERPTVDTLLLEAKICKEQGDLIRATRLLERAREILNGVYPDGNN